MNLLVTCKCGHKFRLSAEQAAKLPVCPGCGKNLKVAVPNRGAPSPPPAPPIEKPATAPPPAPVEPEEEEVKLQELVGSDGIPIVDVDEVEEFDPPSRATRKPGSLQDRTPVRLDDEGTDGYGLDANDGLANLDTGTGVYGTFAVLDLDERADCLAFGANGDWALAGQGSDVLLLDMKTKRDAGYFEEHRAEVTAVALSATEPLAVSGDSMGELRYWSVAPCRRMKKIDAHDGTINSVALSADGRFAATGGEDGCTNLWELATGKRRPLSHSDWSEEWNEAVTCVTFSRDGTKLLAGGSEGRIAMWSVDTGKRLKRYPGLEVPISCIRLSDEGGKVIATTHPVRSEGYFFLVLCHWQTATGKPIERFNIVLESRHCCIAPDRGGARVILGGGGADPWMGVWSLENGRCLHGYDDLRGSPVCMAVSPKNNRVLASLHTDRLQLFGLEPY